AWSFAPQAKDFEPFKKLIKTRSHWADIVKEFNFNLYPSTMSVTSNWNRTLNTIQLRSLGDVDFEIAPTYAKNFQWNRTYNFKYNPFKSLSIDYSANDQALVDEPIGLIDTKEKKNEVWQKVLQGGRNTNYNQNLAINYNIPINKIPEFDYITANVGYASTYSWTANAWQLSSDPAQAADGVLVQNTLGNIISNTQNDHAKVDLNFKRLYDKVPFLKTYDAPNPNPGDKKQNDRKREATKNAREKIQKEIDKLKEKRDQIKVDLKAAKAEVKTDTTGKKLAEVKKLKADLKKTKKEIRLKKKDYRSKQKPSDPFISLVMRPLLGIKKIDVEYRQNKATTLPGFVGYSRILGEDYMTKSPGWGFVFGSQPGDKYFKGVDEVKRAQWLNDAATKNWITNDSFLNQQFMQNRSDRIDVTGTYEPYPDLKLDVTLFRDYTNNFSEFFKYLTDSVTGVGSWQHLSPIEMGSYSISYLPIKSFFTKVSSEGYSSTYDRFIQARSVISQRLGNTNTHSDPNTSYYNPSDSMYSAAFRDGYGPLSQDVLIPAFLAAYSKKDPNKISLNPFNQFPMPNFRISYSGLSKFKWAQKYFSNITLSSAYNSTLTVTSYQTNLSYLGDGTLYGAQQKDSLSGNFYSLYTMPSVIINEQFSPLIGLDLTMKNNVTAKFDYRMSRTLTMSFADFQMIEMNSKQFTIGAGYKIKGLMLPFKLPNGKKIRLNNDLSFRFDFSYRDNIIINHLIDQGNPQITQGAQTITIQPSIDYIVSKQLTVRLFFDQTRTIPKISSSYPTTNTKAGLTLRFSLTQ
ncbi:MAG TPA: cell surface protein SprA, partial [Chitinophagales bacterium]|nr:cell surface protein SprA [Chitinophagales bacterium]